MVRFLEQLVTWASRRKTLLLRLVQALAAVFAIAVELLSRLEDE